MTRNVLGVALIVLMVASSLWVMRPFLPALVWAVMIVVPTWPLMLRVQRWCGGSRIAATTVMSLLILLVVLVPVGLAIITIVRQADEGLALANKLLASTVPPAPAWAADIPLVGEHLSSEWNKLAGSKPGELAERLQPYVGTVARWVASQAGHLGILAIHFLLTVVIAGILYAHGERGAAALRRFAHRLAGERGDGVVVLAGQAIAAVALGIVVTAAVQSVLGAIGLWAASVPAVPLLTSVMFILCIAQLGVGPVLFIAVGWLYWIDRPVAATVLLVWSALVMVLDNVLRPWLIQRGADLPLLLILVGVIGGLLSFGVVGLFVGPVVLAVTYTLLNAWIDANPDQDLPSTRASP